MQNRKHILLIGLNGNIGQSIVPFAIKQYFVHCAIRNPPKIALNSIFFKIIDANATNSDQLKEAMEDKYAVISAFGVPQNAPETAIQDYTKILLQTMQEKGVKRLVAVGSSGSLKKNEEYFYKSNEYPENLKKRAEDHTKAMELIQKSELNYTIVCPHNVTKNEQESEIEIAEEGKVGDISTLNIGKFLTELVENKEFDRKMIGVMDKKN